MILPGMDLVFNPLEGWTSSLYAICISRTMVVVWMVRQSAVMSKY